MKLPSVVIIVLSLLVMAATWHWYGATVGLLVALALVLLSINEVLWTIARNQIIGTKGTQAQLAEVLKTIKK